MYGVEEFTAIINQPESGILAVGSILDKPEAINKEIVIRPVMKMTLSYDRGGAIHLP
jgi:pyruvate dehydrogenase E2 component (dihydrolipoamide acetyltransferase)